MKYRIKKLKVSVDDVPIVYIPEGCIPIEYNINYIERLCPGINPNLLSKAMFGERTYIDAQRTITVLEPISAENSGEDICFFCESEVAKDKIGIRPICQKCITEIYAKIKESDTK